MMSSTTDTLPNTPWEAAVADTAMPPVATLPDTPWAAFGSGQNSSPPPVQPNLMGKVKNIAGQVSSAIGKASDIAAPLVAAVTPGSGIPELAQQLGPQISQAEGQAVSDAGLAAGYPKTGAVIGTGVAMAPDIAMAAGGMAGLQAAKADLPNAVRGLLSTPEELGPEIQAGEKAAGIDSGTLPVRRGTVPKFPGLDGLPANTPPVQAPTVAPMVYPKDTATFLNFARSRVDSLGEQLQPQELADYRVILNNMIKGGEVKPGTKPYALASQLYADTNSLFTDAVAGREDLNQVYKYAKILPSIGDSFSSAIKKYGPHVVEGALTIGGGGAIWEGIKHLFGGSSGEH